MTATELVARLDVLPRLQAIVAELDVTEADVDVPRTLAEGLLEEIERAVADKRGDA